MLMSETVLLIAITCVVQEYTYSKQLLQLIKCLSSTKVIYCFVCFSTIGILL